MHSFQLWTTLALLFRLSFFFIVLEVSQTSHASTDTSQVSLSATKISQTTSVYGDSMVMTSDGTINLPTSTPEPAPWSSTSLFTLSLSTQSTEAQSWLTSSSSSSSSSSLLISLTSSMSSTSSSSEAAASSSLTSSSSTSSLLSSSLSTSTSSLSTSSSSSAVSPSSQKSSPALPTKSTSSSSEAAASSSLTSSSSTSSLLSSSLSTSTSSLSTSSSSSAVIPSSQKSSPALPTKSTAATSSASSTSLSSSQSFQTSSSSPQSTSSFSSPLTLSSSVQAPSLSPSKSSSSSTTLTSPSASSSSSSSSFSRHLESSIQTLPSTQPSTEKPSDSKEFAGTAVLKFDWFEELSNTSSNGYKNFSRELTVHLTDILGNSAYGSDFVRVEVYNFRNGSVIFDFTVYLKSTTVATEDFLIRVMKKGVAGSKFIITQVDVRQTFPRTSPTGKPSEEPPSRLETWLIVLIACGAVIILLLLTLLFLGTQNRRLRKELSSPSRKQSTSILHQEDSLFIQTQFFSHEMYAMSPTPSDSCHNDSHGFKTFSPENGDDKGAVNESYVADGGKESDHEDEKESTEENTFI